MTYAEAVLEQIQSLRAHREDALLEGKTTQASHLQKAIVKLHDRYLALTDID